MTQQAQPQSNQWRETAEQLGIQSANSVACPCCASTSLSVRDVEYGFGHEKGIQRYVACGCCGAFTGVNVKRAGPASEDAILRAAE